MNFRKTSLILSSLSALLLAPAAQAVVVVGGDNGWEISFDGNVHGFYVYSDRDAAPMNPPARTLDVNEATGAIVAVNPDPGTMAMPTMPAAGNARVTQDAGSRDVGTISSAGETARIRTGLLPAFFSFNVRSPEVNGLTGSARISFAPQIQNANTKNQLNGVGGQLGAAVDLREAFFNVSGDFGTLSVGRTLSLFQRHNILTDMTLFGVGAEGGSNGGGTTLGRIGYGYVYPQFNARISYAIPSNIEGFTAEVGIYDPSRICGGGLDEDTVRSLCAGETDSPRWEAEATFTTEFDQGSLKFFLSGMYQNAELTGTADDPAVAVNVARDVTEVTSLDVDAQGIAGGVVLNFADGFQAMASGYTGEALGSFLMLDIDSLDAQGRERDNQGYIGQLTYTFKGVTKIGISYGASEADETRNDTARRTACGDADADYANGGTCDITQHVAIERNSATTVGVYHDVTSWFKVVAEYSKVEVEWHDGRDQESDVFSVGAFFLW